MKKNHGVVEPVTPATTLSVASQNTRSNPNAPIIKVSSSENMGSTVDSSTSNAAKSSNATTKERPSEKASAACTEKTAQNIDPKGFEEMRDANRKLAERNAKLRDELQELREQQAKMQQQQVKDLAVKKTSVSSDAKREVYHPHSAVDNASKDRRKVYSSSSTRTDSSGRPKSAGPLKKEVGKHSYKHAQGSPRNAINVMRQEAARQTYSRQPRPQSAGSARSKTSSSGNPLIKAEGNRPENRPGSAARRRSQNLSGKKVVRPGSAPARRPNYAGNIKQMVQDAAINTGADEETRIRSIVSAETWDGRGRSDMYHFGKVLGTGSFGVVRLVLHKLTNTKIAVKTYDKRKIKDAAQLKRVQQEIRLMARTNHPNIVRLYETLESVHRVHLVMEYASGGNLCNYVKLKKRLDENEARAIFQQLASAIAYLHTLNIVHRDIKLENILIDGKKNIKITDFGFSVYVQQKKLKIFCGTPSYMPPEIVMRREYYGPPVDCWSLGVLLYATLCGCFPFTANSYPNLYKKIARGQWRAAHSMSQSVSDLLRRMLTVDAAKRIDMNAAKLFLSDGLVLEYEGIASPIMTTPSCSMVLLQHQQLQLLEQTPVQLVVSAHMTEIDIGFSSVEDASSFSFILGENDVGVLLALKNSLLHEMVPIIEKTL
jgi:serine/threonine protein kinase